MIKQVRLSDVQSTPFVVTREWSISNKLNDSLILLSQTGSDGGELSIAWNRIIYNDGTNIYTSSLGSISLSQQSDDDIIYQEGISGSGLFDPDSEPKNIGGTYKRLVYTTINNLFYNRSIQALGLENISLQKDLIRKFVGDKIRSFMIPQRKFGDKVLENSVKLTDNSLDNEYDISDDGFNNLYAYSNLFSRVQKIGNFKNQENGEYFGYCDFYTTPNAPSGSIILSGSWSGSADLSGSVELFWNDPFTNESGYKVYRKTGSLSYSEIGDLVANTIYYKDTTANTSSIYDYYVLAYNNYGNSTGSNIATVITPTPTDDDVIV